MNLSELPNGSHAYVTDLLGTGSEVGEATLRRLAELGFIEGEPVQVLRSMCLAINLTKRA